MDAKQIMQMFLTAAHHQIVSSSEGKAILEAGLGAQLHELLHSIAANAAQPIAVEIEEMVELARGGSAAE